MAIFKVPIEPGGQLSDLVQTDLGKNQHQQVVNLRQEKINEWECVKGYKEVSTEFTDIRAAVEISDDLSGDRFLLVQDGTTLKRLDYDSVNSPLFGYENETPDTITLPSGITISANGTTPPLRFFYFRGIVRISGASEPMWYGYVDRTFFPNSWATHTLDDFNSDRGNWTSGVDATTTHETTSPLLEGAGTLQVDATAANGYAWHTYTCVVGTKYKFFVKGLKESGQTSQNYKVQISTILGTGDIAVLTHDTDDEWHVFEYEFTATATQVHVEFSPVDNGDYAHFDYALMRVCHQIVVADWHIFPASLNKPTSSEITDIDAAAHGQAINSAGFLNALFSFGFGYDQSQFSLMADDLEIDTATNLNNFMPDTIVNAVCSGTYGVVKFDITIKDAFDLYRVTSFLFNIYYKVGEDTLLDPKWNEYNTHAEIDFTEEYEEGHVFTKTNFYYDSADPKRLYLSSVSQASGERTQRYWDGYFQVGRRIKLSNAVGSLDTIITTYNDNGVTEFGHYIEVLDDVDALQAITGTLSATGVWIEKIWDYSSGYKSRISIEIEGTNEGGYDEVTEIPAGTKHNTPNYSHWTVIEEVAYIASLEDEEEDAIRYSPQYQYDNFPIGNLQQILVGDIDQTRAVVKRHNRLVILKRNSLTQGNFVSGQYYEDISPKEFGLYATFGYKVIGTILYFMEKPDFYMFTGSDPQPIMVNEMQRQLYRNNVDENSFIAHDSLNNEIWLILGGIILIYHPERKEWYTRSTDITAVTAFNDIDKRMMLCSADKIVCYNHSETVFDEDIFWSVKTKVIADDTEEYLKKVNKIKGLMKGSSEVNIVVRDIEEVTSRNCSFTPHTTKIQNNRASDDPKFMFKELEILISVTSSDSQQATIRNIQAEVEAWK